MRAIPLLTLAATLALATAARAETADERAILEVERGIADAQTIDALMPYYAEDAVVYDVLAPAVHRGAAAIRRAFAPQMATIRTVKVDFKEMHIESRGDLGYAVSVQYGTITKPDGTTAHGAFRDTDILRRINGRWLVVYQHVSFPADPATGEALMNHRE